MLDPNLSRTRQQRLLKQMQQMRLDAIVVGWPGHVYYLSAFFTGWLHQSAFVLFADGRSWMVTANTAATGTAADQVIPYEAQWFSTQRSEQPAVVVKMVAEELKLRRADRVGVDASLASSQLLMQSDANFEPIDPILWQMRRAKDADELALMRHAIRCTEAMYARAKQIIEPGIPELKIFGELHSAAVATAGEPLTALLGNDYQSHSGGGPARKDHIAQDGDLYILDLGPCHRGYFADNARTFAVNRKPTDAQMKAWDAVMGVHKIVQEMAKPGVRCRDIWDACDRHYNFIRRRGMPHHLGHGVGLQPHEYPHLNPHWDDVLIEGEIFTAEPGVYSDELQAGMRIENQYLVTEAGIENLIDFPMELA